MKYLLAIALLYPLQATPEHVVVEWWKNLGEPCSTVTDRIEGTCNLEVKRRPEWK